MSGANVGRLRGTDVALLNSRIRYLRLPGQWNAVGDTFSRADATQCASQQLSTLQWATVPANILRDGHYVGGTRTILLEEARTNVALNNQSLLTSSGWAGNSGSEAVTGGKADNRNGTAATDLGINSPPHTTAALFRTPTLSSLAYTVSCFVAPGASATADIDLFDATAGLHYDPRVIAWNGSSVPTVIRGSGIGTLFAPTQGSNGFWRIGLSTPVLNSADTIRVYLHPSPIAGTGDSFFADPQIEAGTFPTSPIATGASSVARAADRLVLAGVRVSTPATLFYRYWDLATGAWLTALSTYASGTPIVPPVNRAYSHIAVFEGAISSYAALSALRIQ